MFNFRDFVIFLAGAEFFHAFFHVLLPFIFVLPLDARYIIITPTLNLLAIVINSLISIALLWWASRLR